MNTSRQPQLLRAVLTKPRYRVDFSCPILDDFIRCSFTKLSFVNFLSVRCTEGDFRKLQNCIIS